MNYLEVFIGAVVAILGYLLGSKLLSSLVERSWKVSDDQKALLDQNKGKLIDANQLAMEILHNDMLDLKTEVKDLQTELSAVRDEKSGLDADNKILRNSEKILSERIDKQGGKIEQLSKDLSTTRSLLEESKAALTRRDNEVSMLKRELHETRLEVHALTIRMNNQKSEGPNVHSKSCE